LDSAENETVWTDDLDNCNKDDIYTFKAGDKVSVAEGANDCLPSDPNNYDMVWTMANDNAGEVVLLSRIWTILSMSNTEIVLWTTWNSGTEDHVKKLTFKRN
jgi:hypothetical protein